MGLTKWGYLAHNRDKWIFAAGMTGALTAWISLMSGCATASAPAENILRPQVHQAESSAPIVQALALIEGRKLDEAINAATAAILDKPNAASGYLIRGQARLLKGDYELAISDLSRVIGIDPRNVEALARRAVIRSFQQDYSGAISDAELAVIVAPRNSLSYWSRASVRESSGDWEGAIRDYGEMIANNPRDFRAYAARAVAKTKVPSASLADAQADAERALSFDPKASVSHFALGVVLSARREHVAALSALEWALKLEPWDGTYEFKRAEVKFAMQDFAGATADAERVVARARGIVVLEAWQLLGDIRGAQGDWVGAISKYEKALELRPNYVPAMIGRSNARIEIHPSEVSEALNDAEQAVRVAPKNPFAAHALGVAQSASGDLDRAIATFDRAIALNPDHALSYAARGAAKAQRGDFKEAKQDVEHALGLVSDLVPALFLRAKLKFRVNDFGGALTDLDKVIAGQPQSVAALLLRAEIKQLIPVPDLIGAIADADRAVALRPDAAEVYGIRGAARHGMRDDNGAMNDLNQAIRLNPNLPRFYAGRGRVRAQMGDHSGAIGDLDRALGTEERVRSFDEAAALSNRGSAKQALGDIVGAIRDYDEALRLNPAFSEIYYNRGIAWSITGDFAKAESDYALCIERNPSFPNAYVNRGALRHFRGDLSGALADCDRAIALVPEFTEAYLTRARVYLQRGESQRAIEDIDRVLAKRPDATMFAKRARLRLAAGDFSGALEDFERAISDPDPYTRFFHLMAARRLGAKSAEEALQSALPNWPEGWAKAVGRFLLGQLPEKDFLALSESGDAKLLMGQRCEAYYYAGMGRLLAGDPAAAADCFRHSLATGQSGFVEFDLAKAELKRLDGR